MATATLKNGKIVISKARLAFPELFVAKAFQGEGKAQYSATLLLDRSNPDGLQKVIEAEELRVAKEKWGAKAEGILAEIRANNRGALKKGELKASYDGFPGNDFIACNNETRPTVVDRRGQPVTAADGTVYAGCYVLAHITLWAQDNQWGKRINANITGVQFVEDGDAFGGGAAPSSTEEFADLGAGEEAADLMA